ncbi:MAG: hypothetical protein HC911_06460 [Chloroflexaceae bacterium]|nr:hypothetical protein [Chloroflexaceae bacterium]
MIRLLASASGVIRAAGSRPPLPHSRILAPPPRLRYNSIVWETAPDRSSCRAAQNIDDRPNQLLF